MPSSSLKTGWVIALGLLLFTCFLGLGETEPGLEVAFIYSWTNSTPSELYMWLGVLLLVFPAGLCFTWAASPWILRTSARLPKPTLIQGLGLLTLVAIGLYHLGNHLILHGYPLTDDEWSARYGGQLLALGQLHEAIPPDFEARPGLFLFMKDSLITSFDWLGAQLAWGISTLTYSGSAVFAVLAALALLGTTLAVHQRLGPRWGSIAALLFLLSPMAAALSISTHAHLGSRAFLALGLAGWITTERRPGPLPTFLTGLAFGVAWLFRPMEVTTLTAPLLIHTLYSGMTQQDQRRRLLPLLAGGMLPIAAFVCHSWLVTGGLLPPRLAHNELPMLGNWYHPPMAFLEDPILLWRRFGANLSYNLFMLSIWGLGLPTLGLVLWGSRTDRFTKLLLAGLGANLLLALLHDNYGLHVVGPIHYSEAVIFIVLLAAHGLHNLIQTLNLYVPQAKQVAIVLIGATLFANGIFLIKHFAAMERQAQIHATLYSAIEEHLTQPSVLLAPHYSKVWMRFPEFKRAQSFVYSWRLPDPSKQEHVTILHFTPESPQLIQKVLDAYPDRPVYVLGTGDPKHPQLLIVPLTELLSGFPQLQSLQLHPAQRAKQP